MYSYKYDNNIDMQFGIMPVMELTFNDFNKRSKTINNTFHKFSFKCA